MADTDSTAAFAELKDEGGKSGKQGSNGKAAVTIPINPVSSTKPLPTSVPKPGGGPVTDGFSTLFQPSSAERFTGEWFMHYLQQRRVLILLLLALFLLILVIWIGALGKAPATSTGSTGSCQRQSNTQGQERGRRRGRTLCDGRLMPLLCRVCCCCCVSVR